MKKLSYLGIMALVAISTLTLKPSSVIASEHESSYVTKSGNNYEGTGDNSTHTEETNNNTQFTNNNSSSHLQSTNMPINNGLLFLTIAGTLGGILVLRKKAVLVKV